MFCFGTGCARPGPRNRLRVVLNARWLCVKSFVFLTKEHQMRKQSYLSGLVVAASLMTLLLFGSGQSPAANGSWKAVPASEAEDFVGALCYLCNSTSPCDAAASCAGVTCVTHSTPLISACLTQGGVPWGCSGGGTYKTCGFVLWQSCPSSQGTASSSPACGSVQTMRCNGTFWCTGFCTVTTHAGACRYDCL